MCAASVLFALPRHPRANRAHDVQAALPDWPTCFVTRHQTLWLSRVQRWRAEHCGQCLRAPTALPESGPVGECECGPRGVWPVTPRPGFASLLLRVYECFYFNVISELSLPIGSLAALRAIAIQAVARTCRRHTAVYHGRDAAGV